MNIYKVEQDLNIGYDTYDSFVCFAETEQEARETYPSVFITGHKDGKWFYTQSNRTEIICDNGDWIEFSKIDQVKVTLLGEAKEGESKGVILASFNAG